MMNLLTRAGWEARIDAAAATSVPDPQREAGVIAATRPSGQSIAALRGRPVTDVAVEIVDYMLFVDEAFDAPIVGSSQFAERFVARGPTDPLGRSLRQLNLTTRLMVHPLSYVIYGEQFDALPAVVKDAVYQRLWTVLSGRDPDPIYRKLLVADRRAIVEILVATKPGVPSYFRSSAI